MNRVILYQDDVHILLKDKDFDAEKWPDQGPYSFGLKKRSCPLFGAFPLNNHVLQKRGAIKQLNLHIQLGEEYIAKYDKRFTGGAEEYIQVCRSMIDALDTD